MFADGIKHAAHVDQSFSVQLQRFRCGSTSGSQSSDLQVIFAPGKVFVPPLLSRIIDRNQETCDGVGSRRPGRLMPITALPTLSQVFGGRLAAGLPWSDVIDRRCLWRVTAWIAAILAVVPRALND